MRVGVRGRARRANIGLLPNVSWPRWNGSRTRTASRRRTVRFRRKRPARPPGRRITRIMSAARPAAGRGETSPPCAPRDTLRVARGVALGLALFGRAVDIITGYRMTRVGGGRGLPAEANQKAKGKRQKAKIRKKAVLLQPTAFRLDPFGSGAGFPARRLSGVPLKPSVTGRESVRCIADQRRGLPCASAFRRPAETKLDRQGKRPLHRRSAARLS